MIEFKGVSRCFAGKGEPFLALDNVSFTVQRGEFVCLLGRSGCGKTTLLHLLAGFIAPSAGETIVGGERVEKPSPERSVVFQEYALFPWMTVIQNVSFGLRKLGISKQEQRERANGALEMVRLADQARRYPHELSGGQRQRVAVARSLVTRPRVLLMDEPFAAVDALTRSELQNDLLQLWKETGVTILFVTHNIDEAIFLAQRVAVMRHGRISGTRVIAVPYPRLRGEPAFAAEYRAIEELLYGNTEELLDK